jgi:ribosomal-protein-alanine N-acetyltransferase
VTGEASGDASEGDPAGLSLRRMTADDLPVVMEIELAAFKHPWSEELFRNELEHAWSNVLVAERDEGSAGARVVGFIIFWLVHDEVHVLNVAVAAEERRRGVARALLSACVARGRAQGSCLVTLEVRRSNTAALRLYEAFGFRSAGVRPNYYSDEGEDAIVMLLDL